MIKPAQSIISRAVAPAALLLAIVVFSSFMILTGSFTAVAQQEGPKKKTEDPGAEQRSPGNDVTVRIETRLVNVKIRREGAAAKTRRGYNDR